MTEFSIDVGIVGAGLAGLTCARHLQRAGLTVALFDKSRGIGGRLATRRVIVDDRSIPVDHGLPFLTVQGEQTENLLRELGEKNILRRWDDRAYFSPDGMNSIAKSLATGLEIRRDYLVTRLVATGNHWLVEGKEGESESVKALVLAVPAPQALALFQASNLSIFLGELASVLYDPGLTVIAGYTDSPPIPERSSDFRHIGRDSDKRPSPSPTVFVLHSSAEFARENLDRPDLETVKRELIERSGLPSPAWSQIHRWRYALPRRALGVPCLASIDPLPLVCCGDWCSGTGEENAVEAALTSGIDAARAIGRFFGPIQ